MGISYLPALKNKDGDRIIGLMGQFDDEEEARAKLYRDAIFWISLGLTPNGVVEYDSEVGLPNIPINIDSQWGRYEGACISGPIFDEQTKEEK